MKIRNRHLAVALVLVGMAISGCSQQPAMIDPAMAAPVPAPGYVPEAEPEIEQSQQPQQPQQQQWIEPEQPPLVEPVQQPRRVVVPRPKMPARMVMPKTKAKGTYRGAVHIDRNAVQQYQY